MTAPIPFPLKSRVRVTEGHYAGRAGFIFRVPRGFADYRYVEFDPRPRERTRKTGFIRVAHLADEGAQS